MLETWKQEIVFTKTLQDFMNRCLWNIIEHHKQQRIMERDKEITNEKNDSTRR